MEEPELWVVAGIKGASEEVEEKYVWVCSDSSDVK